MRRRRPASFILAFRAFPMVLTIAALASLLFYWGVLQKIVQMFALAPGVALASAGCLGIGAAVHIFVGMVEAPLIVRPYLAATMSRGELFALMSLRGRHSRHGHGDLRRDPSGTSPTRCQTSSHRLHHLDGGAGAVGHHDPVHAGPARREIKIADPPAMRWKRSCAARWTAEDTGQHRRAADRDDRAGCIWWMRRCRSADIGGAPVTLRGLFAIPSGRWSGRSAYPE